MPDFASKVSVPQHTLFRELADEAVLLNLASGTYFGLDETGTSFWQALTTTGSIQEAYDLLLSEYEVEPEDLRHDLSGLLDKLIDHGLVEISSK
ncbi:MAG: PqqD family protein [Acidobacteria bacterium]|nr:MAG: PqqD family protein [Acidobacteriota bacterium]